MTFTKSLNKVPITTFSRRCKAGLMPLTRMLWPSGNIIMQLNFLALQCCLSFFTNGGITFCSGRWSVNRPDTQYAWNTRSYKVLWKKPNLPMKGMILSSLYQVITKHCPRVRSKRIHLKGEDGKFLTPMEETAALSYPSLPAPDIPRTVTELEGAIARIPATKAVLCTALFWKSQAPFSCRMVVRAAHLLVELLTTFYPAGLEGRMGTLAS